MEFQFRSKESAIQLLEPWRLRFEFLLLLASAFAEVNANACIQLVVE